jgi:hypothetical protein
MEVKRPLSRKKATLIPIGHHLITQLQTHLASMCSAVLAREL